MLIELKNVSVSLLKKPILNDINLKISPEKFTMLLGLNGTGKSTLLKSITGFIPLESGEILFDNKQADKISARQRSQLISYIPQISDTNIKCTVLDFVLMGANPYLSFLENPSKEHIRQAEQALSDFGINELENKSLDCISGGERQLCYLARSQLQNADFMVLDEPVASLDYKRQHIFLDRLYKYIKKNNKSAIMSVHNPNHALMFAHEVIVLNNKTVQAVIKRSEDNFEEKLYNELKDIYGEQFKLIKNEDNYFFFWEGMK